MTQSNEEDEIDLPIKYIEEDDWEPHPPEQFRDRSNGE